MNAGLLIACVLPLVVCWYLLRSSDADAADGLVNEVLLSDLVAAQPLLFASPPQRRLPSHSAAEFEGSEQPSHVP